MIMAVISLCNAVSKTRAALRTNPPDAGGGLWSKRWG